MTIRPATDEDCVFFTQLYTDDVAVQMAAFVTPMGAEQRLARWRQILADPEGHVWTIVHEGDVAGYVGYFIREGQQEVTYWIARAYWGRGIATRALAELLQTVTARPMQARVATDNLRSQRVLEKCGFTVVGSDSGYADARKADVEELIYELARTPDRPYSPIECSLHDQLESAATLKKKVRITFRDSAGGSGHAEDRITDIFAKDGAEFVKLGDGREVRLDDLQEVDGVSFESSS